MNRWMLMAALAVLLGPAPCRSAEGWAPVSSERWVPLVPEGRSVGCELSTPAGEAVHGRWRLVDAGDTLRYAIRGSGLLRVESRALVTDGEDSDEYRLSVRTGPSTVRRLLRRSDHAADLLMDCGVDEAARVRVLETDRWETPIAPGSESVEVALRGERGLPVLVRVLARGDIERPEEGTGEKTGVRWGLRAGVAGLGFTTNAYLAPTDSVSAETKFFWPLEVQGSARVEPRRDVELDFSYEFEGVFFTDEILNVYRNRLRARQGWSGVGLGRLGKARLQAREGFSTKNRTYFGRGYNEEVETAAGNPPAEDSYLADRFDWREYVLGLDAEVAATDEVEYGVSLGYVRRDYVEDYEGDPDTYALDWGGAFAGIRGMWQSEADFYVAAGLEVRDRNYDEKFSRDSTGSTVSDQPSHLSYWPITVEVGRGPRRGLRWEGSVQRERIVDHFEGYWDRTNWRLEARAAYVLQGGHRFDARIARTVTNYDRSRVGNTPSGPIREKDTWRIGAEGAWLLGEHMRAIATIEFLDRNNNSPTFDYSLVEGLAGLSWTY